MKAYRRYRFYRCCHYNSYLHHSLHFSRTAANSSEALPHATRTWKRVLTYRIDIIYSFSPTGNERPSTIPHTSQHAHFNKNPTCSSPARHINLRTAQQHHNTSLEHHSSRRHQWQFSAPMLAARPFRNQHYSRHSRRSISQPRKCHQCNVPNHPR